MEILELFINLSIPYNKDKDKDKCSLNRDGSLCPAAVHHTLQKGMDVGTGICINLEPRAHSLRMCHTVHFSPGIHTADVSMH